MDFKGINLVINYDLPQSATDYIHRVGRTGRMGRKGSAETYYTDDDVPHLRVIVNVMKQSGQEVPEFLKEIKTESKTSRQRLQVKPTSRASIGTPSVEESETTNPQKKQNTKHKKDDNGNKDDNPQAQSRTTEGKPSGHKSTKEKQPQPDPKNQKRN